MGDGPISSRIGDFEISSVAGERVRAYIPPDLPPNPPVRLDRFIRQLDLATTALGRLDGVATALPSQPLFIFMYIRKEALLSSQIEGTQSSLADLLLFENDETAAAPYGDVEEVSSYVKALNYGLERLRGGFPLSLRLVREIHAILLQSGRGSRKQPGEFRSSQNWIGGNRPATAIYVPPPPHRLMECLNALEQYLHVDEPPQPLLVKAALVHVQFESIHPFLDGNGRLGRLLITFLLCAAGALREPTLYLSLYFKLHRRRYYELLQGVRETGDWESWIEFFLEGVVETADQATGTARKLMRLFEIDRNKIMLLGRPAASAIRVFELLQRRPILSVGSAAKELGISEPTVQKSFLHLCEIGVVDEITGKRRRRLYRYRDYLQLLDEGTEPLAANVRSV